MDQNTEEWLKFRGNSIGASEIPIIMGISPYKKRAKLLQEKAFPFPKDETKNSDDKNFIFAKGHAYEKKIRNFVEFDCDLSFPLTPTVVFKNDNYKTPIHASLDGITDLLSVGAVIIIECKFVGYDAFEEIKKEKKAPIHYEAQVQQQLLITNANKCIFAFCREVPILVNGIKTGVDLEYSYFDIFPNVAMHEQILIEATKFWDEVLELRGSGPKDYSEVDELINRYQELTALVDITSASADGIKTKIFEIVGEDKIEKEKYTIQTVKTKGRETKDYASFVADMGLQLTSKYISVGKESVSQRITFKKTKA